MARSISRRDGRPVKFVTDFAKATEPADESLVIPEDLTALTPEELSTLQEQAVEAFNAIYQNGEVDLSEEDLVALASITEGTEAINAEVAVRETAATERRDSAAALAARVAPVAPEVTDEAETDEADAETDEEDDSTEDGEVAPVEGEVADEVPEAIAASSARKEVRVNLAGLRSRQTAAARQAPAGAAQTMRDVVMAAPDVPGFSNGQGMDFGDLGRAVDSRLQAFNPATYAQAARDGRALRQQFGIATIRKPFASDLVVSSNDPEHVETVFARAADQSRLPGGSLVASGGWCAPSETLYDLFEVESRDGLFSLPEVNISRGGIRFTQGPDFASLYSQITGFHYTEAQDIAGTYAVDANGVGTGAAGSKPCYKVDCPDFVEERLELDGLCITAGLLQQRGFPEVIARTVRGALVAHDHRISARLIAALVADSTAVTMPADQVGATAPILSAIALQVEHYRDVHRLSRNTVLEAVFPFWVHGAIRADLSRRLGVDLLSVPDSRINGWFSERGINPQFVYNWQGLSAGVAATAATAYPTTVSFLLYAAGTWVKGGSDVITLDTIYDSTLLGSNDYTALFTEEGWLVAKRGHDSRVVTTNICVDGATAAGIAIDCDGSVGV